MTKKIKTNEFTKRFFLRHSKCNSLMIKPKSSPGRIVKKKVKRKSKIKLNISLKGRQVIWLNSVCYIATSVFNFSEERKEEKKSLGSDPKHW